MDLNTLLSTLIQGIPMGADALIGPNVPAGQIVDPKVPQPLINLAAQRVAPQIPLPTAGSADVYHSAGASSSPSLLALSGISAYVQLVNTLAAQGTTHDKPVDPLARSLLEASETLKFAYSRAATKLPPQLQAKDWRFSVTNGRLIFSKGQNELSPRDFADLKLAFSAARVESAANQVAAAMTSMRFKRNTGTDPGSLAWGRFEVDETNFDQVVDLRAYVTATVPGGGYTPDTANSTGSGGQTAASQTAAGQATAAFQAAVEQADADPTTTGGKATAAGQAGVGQLTTGHATAGQAAAGQAAAARLAANQAALDQLATGRGAAALGTASRGVAGGLGVEGQVNPNQANPNQANPNLANAALRHDIPVTLGGMYLGDLVTSKPGFFKADSRPPLRALESVDTTCDVEVGALLQGRCSCGEVRFTVEDEVEYAFYCHCSRCRLRTGSAFAAIAGVGIDKVQVITGDEHLLFEGECSDGYGARCGRCHAFLFAAVRGRQYLHVSLGALAGKPSRLPDHHVYVGSKAPWYQITDGLPQYEELPPA